MLKGVQYTSIQEIKFEIEGILNPPPYDKSDSSLYKIMHYLQSIIDVDEPMKIKRYVNDAIAHIDKNKQEATSENLYEKLIMIKEYCDIRAKYTNIFSAISGLNKILSTDFKIDNQILHDTLSNLNKLLMDIEKELNRLNSKNDTFLSTKFTEIDAILTNLKKQEELKKGTTWVHAPEVLAIIDELNLISYKFKRQKILHTKQEQALNKLNDKMDEINHYVYLRNNDLVELTKLREEENTAIISNETKIKKINSNIADEKKILIEMIKKEILQLQDNFEKSKSEDNLQKIKDESYQQFFADINNQIAKLDDTLMSQYLDELLEYPQKNIPFRFINKFVFNPVKNAHKNEKHYDKIIQNFDNYIWNTDNKPSYIEINDKFNKLHTLFKDQMKIKKEMDEFKKYHVLRETIYEMLKYLNKDMLTLDVIAMAHYEKQKIAEEQRRPGYKTLPKRVKHENNRYKNLDLNKIDELLTEFLEYNLIADVVKTAENSGVSIKHIAIAEKHGATTIATFNQGMDPLIAGDEGHCAGIAIDFAKSVLKNPNCTLEDLRKNYPKIDNFHIDDIGITNSTHHYQDSSVQKKIERAGTKTILHQKDITGKRSQNIPNKMKYNNKAVVWHYAPKDKNATFAQTIHHRLDEILDKDHSNGKVIDIDIWRETEKSKAKQNSKLAKFREIETNGGHALLLAIIKDGYVFVDANYGIFNFKNDTQSTGFDKFKPWFEEFIDISYKNVLTDYFNIIDLSIDPQLVENHISTVESSSRLKA